MSEHGILYDPEEILNAYGDMVFRAAYSLTKNRQDAEDAAQEVFITLVEKQPEFESAAHQKAWLLRAVANRCKSLFRTVWHSRTEGIAEDFPSAGFTVDEQGITDAVNALEPKYKHVIYLYYIEGYSTKEVAKLLDITQNAVLSRMARARAMLKETLGNENLPDKFKDDIGG